MSPIQVISVDFWHCACLKQWLPLLGCQFHMSKGSFNESYCQMGTRNETPKITTHSIQVRPCHIPFPLLHLVKSFNVPMHLTSTLPTVSKTFDILGESCNCMKVTLFQHDIKETDIVNLVAKYLFINHHEPLQKSNLPNVCYEIQVHSVIDDGELLLVSKFVGASAYSLFISLLCLKLMGCTFILMRLVSSILHLKYQQSGLKAS